jgi:hypothetical protein
MLVDIACTATIRAARGNRYTGGGGIMHGTDNLGSPFHHAAAFFFFFKQ